METVTHDSSPLMVYDIDTVRDWLSKFPISLRLKSSSPTHFDHCQVEIQDKFLQQTHSISIMDLKKLTNYHRLAAEIVTATVAKKADEIYDFYYIGTLLTHEKDPSKMAVMRRFFTNLSTSKFHSHLSSQLQSALPFKLADFMHVPDRQTHPSGNWLIVFKSGRTTVRSRTSYKELEKLYRQLLRRDRKSNAKYVKKKVKRVIPSEKTPCVDGCTRFKTAGSNKHLLVSTCLECGQSTKTKVELVPTIYKTPWKHLQILQYVSWASVGGTCFASVKAILRQSLCLMVNDDCSLLQLKVLDKTLNRESRNL